MPIYEYECGQCFRISTAIRCIEHRRKTLTCPNCGEEAQLRVSAVRGKVDKPAVPRKVRK